ncbi:NYN domain-containing protein [Candidatus Corynebacterium faecigallinarum]|uniref:NYN domain-containing protein n=1 Tax=Candidatus Corynebacterium faecigallinarum TaxID=2838528 RepID=UPI003FD589D8
MKLAPRSIHFLDLENLCDHAVLTEQLVEDTLADYIRTVGIGDSDQVIIATNSHNAAVGYLAANRMLNARFLPPGTGRDAADLALIDAIDHTPNLNSFATVVIGSGDHIFAFALARLATHGITATAVSRVRALSAQVRLAAHSVIRLPHYAHVQRARVIDITTGQEIA